MHVSYPAQPLSSSACIATPACGPAWPAFLSPLALNAGCCSPQGVPCCICCLHMLLCHRLPDQHGLQVIRSHVASDVREKRRIHLPSGPASFDQWSRQQRVNRKNTPCLRQARHTMCAATARCCCENPNRRPPATRHVVLPASTKPHKVHSVPLTIPCKYTDIAATLQHHNTHSQDKASPQPPCNCRQPHMYACRSPG
jgi:hypothetical protein